jgi:hypothetical protein
MKSTKTELNKRWQSMYSEWMSGWQASCKDLSTYINQKRGFFGSLANRGKMIDHKTLLDNHATQACKTLASGLLSGMTSPSRPWFRLTIDDLTLDNVPGVRAWLDEVQKRMSKVIEGSNIYSAFYSAYEELGQFGTSAYIILEDVESVIRTRSYTVGEYYISLDAKGRVNGFCRSFWMTAGQMVKEFGLESCSSSVRSAFEQNTGVDNWFKIRHLIEENDERVVGLMDSKNKKYRSAYWEESDGTDNYLAVRGFDRFPVIATRWEVSTTDQIYGYGPGWYALGNTKQLQKTRLDKLISQEKSHNPPMQQDASVTGHTNFLPGGLTKTSANTPNSGVRPAYQIAHDAQGFQLSEGELKESIDKDFFVNLFMMLMNVDTKNMTATEVAERQQEKIMMMGPVLYRLQEELLDPTMELIYGIMLDNGLIPEPPEEVAGMALRVKYVSILAQAQQALGVEQINRVVGFAMNAAQVFPEVVDTIDIGETMREVANLEGVSARLIRDKQQVQAIVEQRNEQQLIAAQASQAGAMAEVANSAADTTKKLSDSKDSQGSSALDKLVAGMKR